MVEKILLVDDEVGIVRSFQRHFEGQFSINIANSGDSGLQQFESEGPFSIVVSDLKMPKMNGIEFLSIVKERYPDTIRIVLSGYADIETAIELVNRGSVFRFLTKPISTGDFQLTLEAALKQYRLERAERDLLQKTLMGTVEVLTEIITFLDPVGFASIPEKRALIRKIVKQLEIKNSLDLELAAVLSTLGAAVVPTPILIKLRTRGELDERERQIVDSIPQMSAKLLRKIPRLEGIAELLNLQGAASLAQRSGDIEGSTVSDSQQKCATILYLVDRFIELQNKKLSVETILQRLEAKSLSDSAPILEAIATIYGIESTRVSDHEMYETSSNEAEQHEPIDTKKQIETLELSVKQLTTAYTLVENVYTSDKVLLATAGTLVSEALLQRLQNYSKTVGIEEPLLVMAPS